ncbi:hypothetical protein EH240_30055 [Mesorhizobium tamadayense]|uniref:Uncharacterized protein n=2 Tax=Mesorhizobium tamadayense TaxID=425306 RepID=A0A3P3F3L7_9HYPH|nr:hypothetical protein [Mesorhizobium tamadayense]RRH93214.1 hypothetical protein EH240_30055 [Mesorhizobium tamadayense]
MDGLLEELDACRNAAKRARNSEEAQELIDRVVNASSTVLDCRASLPPAVARSMLSDDQARRLRDDALMAADECNALGYATISHLEQRRKSAATVLDRTLKSNATPVQLSRVVSAVAEHHVACMEWWEKKARRCERMRSVCAATANLPSTTAEMRQDEEAALRLHTGWALNTKVIHLESRVALAQVKIEPQASTFEPAVREILMGENGRARLLGTFVGDIFPAFLSTSDAVLRSKGRPLDAQHCAVLEGVMERLSEFALGSHDMLAKLSDDRTGADHPLELLGQIVDDAWITAHEVMHLLALQSNTPAIIASPVDAGAAIPAHIAGKTVVAEGRMNGKGNRKPPAGAGSSAAGRPEPQVVAGDSETAPAAKVLVRSDLGTKKLVSAKEAHASASSAAAHLAIWQAPASTEALMRGLTRLDQLLQFDLADQQRTVSQARQMKPEDADHAVNTVVERLQTQTAEIQACLAALEEPRRRGLFKPAQLIEVHDKTVRLKVMLSEARGLAKALNEGRATTTIECMKTYAFPSQKYLEHLREAKELTPADLPRALKGEPGTLFEIRLQPKALRNGAMPSPMWVHIHTKRPVLAGQLATLDDAHFAACHVKSNDQRGHNRQWQDARAAIGQENVVIHRGKLTPAFCKSLLTTVLGGHSRHPLAEAAHRSTQAARYGM